MKWNYVIEILSMQFIIYSVAHNIFDGKFRKLFAVCPAVNALLIAFLEFSGYEELSFFLCNCILYFIMPPVFVKEIEKRFLLYISFLCAGVTSLIISLPLFVCSLVNLKALEAVSAAGYLILSVSTLALSSVKRLTSRIKEPIKSFFSASKATKILLLIFVWLMFAMINTVTVLLSVKITPAVLTIFSSILILTVLLSFAVFFKLIVGSAQNAYYKRVNGIIEANVEQQVRYYRRMERADESLRKFRHDFKNLKIGLAHCIRNNDLKGIADYLNEFGEIADEASALYRTGNPVVNSLLSDKAMQIKDSNIKIEFDGAIPQDALTPADLCVTFGNAIDNAIEACMKIDSQTPKVICIVVRQKGGVLFISITNPVCESVDIRKNSIVSTKADKSLHGIGLYSINSVVRKYGGHMNLKCDENVFTINFDFCLPCEQNAKAG